MFPLSSEETTSMEDSAKCTFCNAPEKPIPTLVDLKKQPHKNVSLPISCKHVCNLSFFLAKKGGNHPTAEAEEKGRGMWAEGAGGWGDPWSTEVPHAIPTAPNGHCTPQLFCCRRYKEEFETVIEELMKEDEVEKELMNEDEMEKELMNEDEMEKELMNEDEVEKELMKEDKVEEELDIGPYADFSQAELRSNIKEKLLQQ